MGIIVSAGICLIGNAWAILIGRFFWGCSAAVMCVLAPKFISELLPPELTGPFGVLNQVQVCIGILAVSLICLAIPDDYENLPRDAFINEGFFRVLFLVPMAIAAVQILLMKTVFRYDTPIQLAIDGDWASLNALMGKMYEQNQISMRISEIDITSASARGSETWS